MPKVKGYGTTFKFTPSGGAETTLGSAVTIGELSVTGNDIDVTTLDSAGGYKEYLSGMKDAGEIPITCKHVKTDPGQIALRTASANDTLCACVETLPDGTTISFSAYVKGWGFGVTEVDGSIEFKATLKLTGAPTVNVS